MHDNSRFPPAAGPQQRPRDRRRMRRPGGPSGLAGENGPDRHGGRALAGGAGLAFYAWLWIMVPTADESAERNARRPASPIAPAVSLAPGSTGAATFRTAPRWSPFGNARRRCFRAVRAYGSASSGTGTASRLWLDVPRRAGALQVPARAPACRVPAGQYPYGKEILLGAGLLLVAGHHDRPAPGRGRAAGDAHSRCRRARRCSHRLDAARRKPPGRAGGQDQGGPGRRLGRGSPPAWRWW